MNDAPGSFEQTPTAANRAGQPQRLEEQIDRYRRALEEQPNSAELACNLGVALARLERWREACEAYRRALRLRPDLAEVECNLGNALKELGHWSEAIAAHRRALALRPGFAEAHYNLGNTFYAQKDLPQAIGAYEQALALQPAYAKAAINLANALREANQNERASEAYRVALRLAPENIGVACQLAALEHRQGRSAEARIILERAVQGHLADADTHHNLGAALYELGCYDEALAHLSRAIELRPDHAEAHTNRAIVRLLHGNLGQGFAEYEWRWRQKSAHACPYRQPRWEGSSLAGRTILLHAEQGAGDLLQFIRYARLVKQRGATVVLGCYAPLARLLASVEGIDRIVVEGEALPPFDVHVPLASLPDILGTTLENIPADVPYVAAEQTLVERWSRELAPKTTFRVGIAWQGNPQNARDRLRSVSLGGFQALAEIAGLQLYSLQKGFGSEQLATVQFPIIDLGSRLSGFEETAAVIQNLDLVITVDTSVGHLTGALGAPGWVMIPAVPDWRWLLEREDSPWYPTLRLFRQDETGCWDKVFDRLRSALASGMPSTK